VENNQHTPRAHSARRWRRSIVCHRGHRPLLSGGYFVVTPSSKEFPGLPTPPVKTLANFRPGRPRLSRVQCTADPDARGCDVRQISSIGDQLVSLHPALVFTDLPSLVTRLTGPLPATQGSASRAMEERTGHHDERVMHSAKIFTVFSTQPHRIRAHNPLPRRNYNSTGSPFEIPPRLSIRSGRGRSPVHMSRDLIHGRLDLISIVPLDRPCCQPRCRSRPCASGRRCGSLIVTLVRARVIAGTCSLGLARLPRSVCFSVARACWRRRPRFPLILTTSARPCLARY